jgi:hypothetical protein
MKLIFKYSCNWYKILISKARAVDISTLLYLKKMEHTAQQDSEIFVYWT